MPQINDLDKLQQETKDDRRRGCKIIEGGMGHQTQMVTALTVNIFHSLNDTRMLWKRG
jgi:hypothetical protein